MSPFPFLLRRLSYFSKMWGDCQVFLVMVGIFFLFVFLVLFVLFVLFLLVFLFVILFVAARGGNQSKIDLVPLVWGAPIGCDFSGFFVEILSYLIGLDSFLPAERGLFVNIGDCSESFLKKCKSSRFLPSGLQSALAGFAKCKQCA